MQDKKFLFILNNDGKGGYYPHPVKFDYPEQKVFGEKETTYFKTGVMRIEGSVHSMIYTQANSPLDLSLYIGEAEMPVHEIDQPAVTVTEAASDPLQAFSYQEWSSDIKQMLEYARSIPNHVKVAQDVYDLLLTRINSDETIDERVDTIYTLYGVTVEVDSDMKPGHYKFERR